MTTNSTKDDDTELIKSFPKYLLENGLIFEINRKVLHPLGLAMVVDIDRNNKRQLGITALVKTEDPEGFVFEQEAFVIGTEKYQKYLKKTGADCLAQRRDKYGFVEQDKEV